MVLRSAGMRRYGNLRRVLLGVLADPPGEKLDGHDAERGVATLARPLGVGQCLEEPRELLVLGDDRLQEVSGLLAADEARTPKALLRSEEHTSELQSRLHLVCRLLLEKKKKQIARDVYFATHVLQCQQP